MATKATPTDLSSSEHNDDTSSSEDQQRKTSKRTSKRLAKKESIKSYVTDVLTKHGKDDEQQADFAQTEMKIGTSNDVFPRYENVSAFRRYRSNADGVTRTSAEHQNSSSDDDLRNHTPTQRVTNKLCLAKYFFSFY
jgi:hypothetical protein